MGDRPACPVQPGHRPGHRDVDVAAAGRRGGGTHDRRQPEVRGALWLGPPKTETAARRIDLPLFLATLLQQVMDGHDHQQVFVTVDGCWHRRSNFARRLWRPACDGDSGRGWPPILIGAVFHGLRHHHKSMLDELGIQEALKFERMGHRMPGIAGVYSHATEPMRQSLRERLQQRWTDLSRRP